MTNENSVTADTATSMWDAEKKRNNGTVAATPKAASRASSNKPPDLVKRIGNTAYEVSFHFSDTSKDTFTDKDLRKNSLGSISRQCAELCGRNANVILSQVLR